MVNTERRLIDATEFLETIEEMDWYSIDYMGGATLGAPSEEYAWYMATEIYHAIENAPTVDAEEVVHGRWLNKTKTICGQEDYRYDCSACGHIYWAAGVENFTYCPNCGAKMDGDGNA